ncbi:MAG: nucleotide exchange factor GrpE [Pseudomonadota bacterium]
MSKKEKHPKTEIDPALIQEAVESVERVTSGSDEPQPVKNEEAKKAVPSGEGADLKDRYLRLAAEFDNFRKRTLKEKSEYSKYANENLIRELLPVLDNFERAVLHAGQEADRDSLMKGVELTHSQLQNVFTRFGVRAESALGQPFDPLHHEAVSHLPSADHPPHTVMDELQKAYFLHDRLIRPALVTVSKEPPEDAPPADEKKEEPGNSGDNSGQQSE